MGIEEFARRVGGAAHRAVALGHRIERIDVGAGQRVTLRPVRPPAVSAKDRLGGGEMDTHRPMIVELTHSDAQSFQFPIRYAVSRTAADGAFSMVGHDLRPIAELQQQLLAQALHFARRKLVLFVAMRH